MKKTILILSIWATMASMAISQDGQVDTIGQTSQTGTTELNTDLNTALKIEAFLGASASYAHGEFIDYQKIFHDVAEEGTVFNGGIRPTLAVSGGVQLRYIPFSEGILKNLGVSLGVQYLQKGFTNQFKMTHTPPEGYKDETDYKEIYRHHYWSVPLQVRWGQKWFATLGATFHQHLSSSKTQKLHREQSGTDALNGGFDTSTSEKKALDEMVIQKSPTDFSVGGGYQFNGRTAVAVRADLGSSIFNETPENYSTIRVELSFFKTLKSSNHEK